MGIFDRLKKGNKHYTLANLQLNARLQPMHRFELEDMIEEGLKEKKLGKVVGGGTTLMPEDGISGCNIEFNIEMEKTDEFITFLRQIHIIPKGSSISINDANIEIGCAEGMALHLNGTDLSPEVYQNCDINELIEQLDNALADIALRLSHWEGNTETSIYYYGKNYVEMEEKILDITKNHPLCEKCRVEQIA